MATRFTVTGVFLSLCLIVSGQFVKESQWPPKCCMEKKFTMTFRSVTGNKPGFSLTTMAIDFDQQMTAFEGVYSLDNGTTFLTYKVIDDFNKASSWTIMEGACTWKKLHGTLGTSCIGTMNKDTTYYGSFNYMGYIPSYTWRTTIWEPSQKGFVYMSVTENECLPVTSNFGGYNDQVVPKPETLFIGGNFYNYTSGISNADKVKWFTVPDRCPPAPNIMNLNQDEDPTFALVKLIMRMHR